jgi:methyl-accepting chemotaxis protein
VGEIANASNEQATGVAQINKGIEQMSQVVQTNSATAEETAAAAEELSSQAELLKKMVGEFNLNNECISDKSEEQKSKEHGKKSEAAKIRLADTEFGKY